MSKGLGKVQRFILDLLTTKRNDANTAEKRQTKSFAYVAIFVIFMGAIVTAPGMLFPASIVAALLALVQVMTSRGIHQTIGGAVVLGALLIAAVSHREFVQQSTTQVTCQRIRFDDLHKDVVSKLEEFADSSRVTFEITSDLIIVRDSYYSKQPEVLCRFEFANGKVSRRLGR